MKTSFTTKIAAIATAAISTLTALNPSIAASFGQKEVEQSKFVAVAVPYGTNNASRQLLIVEQQSNQRDCWSESGSSPVRVDPLLLNFDFSGICGRSTDSNGYSIRVGGQDLGVQYSLNIVNRNNDFLLVGRPTRDRTAPEVVIGKTNGLTNDFSKIMLNPGWRFTKRTYNGQTLGHVYLTNDLTLAQLQNGSDVGSNPGSNNGGSNNGGSNNGGTNTVAFADINSDIYAKEIQEAVSMGFIAGFREDNTFRPQNTLTREQLVAMVLEGLNKLPNANLNIPTQATSRPYSDVDASRWSAAKIKFARDNNIVSGYKDGTFRPEQPVTRAELMAVLRRTAEFSKTMRGVNPELAQTQLPTTFSDTNNHWAGSLINQMSGFCKVASPVNETGNAFSPDASARRNYAAAATLRTIKCVQ